MGFLGFGNYNKPGPGVSKDEPPKAAPVRYFEIYGRKFTKLIQTNLLVSIPFLLVLGLMVLLFFVVEHPFIVMPSANPDSPALFNWWLMYVVPSPLILLSPLVAGLTIVTRNFAREEHAFIWSDFIKAIKNNWKYFSLNGILCYVVYVVLSFSITYYYNMLYQGWFFYLPLGLSLVALLLFLFAQYYLPILFVTFNLNFKQAYKNAFIFGALGMGRNILLTLLFGAIIALVLFIPVNIEIMLLVLFVIVFLFLFSFVSFTINFATYPLIKKMMIDRKEEEETSSGTEQDSFSDLEDTPEEEEQSDEYVYLNGRLIKKSDIKSQDDE
ncbi:DUF624 domain-containing protein [Scatolibacter rhodanostii]|uniref:DUF624 domain-containing protein n=1 Tax=Scatolibacter rhodanostii TaxID=2014781 RepID=UPI00118159FD|nr:DUF624 domain-containing protein [Scatolibacter rhodanostii]